MIFLSLSSIPLTGAGMALHFSVYFTSLFDLIIVYNVYIQPLLFYDIIILSKNYRFIILMKEVFIMNNLVSGIGKDSVKATNMCAILTCIYKNARMSRRDIAKTVGLTSSTVTMLVNEMLECGLLREGDVIDEGLRAGRRALELRINNDFGYILGISIEQDKLSWVLAPLSGIDLSHTGAHFTKSVGNGYSSGDLLPALLEITDSVLQTCKLTGRFCAIGISVPGYVNPEEGISTNSFGVMLPNTNLRAIFEERYQVATFVYNNVRGLASADIGMRQQETPINGLFLKQDPGLGCTMLLNGQVYEGANYFAGEIGHVQVVENGKRCSCGRNGCLTTVVGTNYLLEAAGVALSPSATPVLWRLSQGDTEKLTIKMLLESAEKKDAPIYRIIDEAARLLAGVLETSLLLMDGNTIILFGRLFESDWFVDLLHEYLDRRMGSFRRVQILPSLVPEAERWKGAVQIAMQKYIPVISREISDCGA